jgi:DNA-binding NtrC family response regulator
MLVAAGAAPRWADDARSALAALSRRQGVVIADFGDPRAASIVSEIKRARPATLLLAVADPSRPAALSEIERAGIPAVLPRPLNARLVSLLLGALPEDRARPQPVAADGQAIVSRSPAMRGAIEAVDRAAASRANVLVCGESGSGRAMVAREIHDRGAGADAPFVRIDCSERPGDELEHAIFGTAELSHAGPADRHRVDRIAAAGAIGQARGGTLYLAHLADAPGRVQARLARVLRDREVAMGDARRVVPLDLRVIASAPPGWDRLVSDGGIRDDLARRVAALRVHVPPFRERRDDLPLIAASLLDRVCRAQQLGVKSFDPPALALVSALPWRGNGPEMEAVLGAVARLAPGAVVGIEHVLAAVSLDGAAPRTAPSGTLREARTRFERDYILAVLRHHHGRVPDAARALGLQRTNLYRKMRVLEIGWRRGGTGSGRDGDHDGNRNGGHEGAHDGGNGGHDGNRNGGYDGGSRGGNGGGYGGRRPGLSRE